MKEMEKRKCYCRGYGPTVLRLAVGLMFVLAGSYKLMNPAGIIGMLGDLSFPAPSFFGWLLLVSEIVFGAAVLVGWKLKYAVWPLVVVLGVATIFVVAPTVIKQMGFVNLFFHLLGIAALLSLYWSGPGALAVEKHQH